MPPNSAAASALLGGGYGMNAGSSSGMAEMGSKSGMYGGNVYDQAAATGTMSVSASCGYLDNPLAPHLSALGISNTSGQLNWPLAFRLIPPGKHRDALLQAESIVELAVIQHTAGKVAPAILEEATRDIRKLRRWLQDHEINMAEDTYQTGSSYLRRIESALTIIGCH